MSRECRDMQEGLIKEALNSALLLQKKEDVMRIVEAEIQGCLDLSPEEMVDAAFLMVNKIHGKITDEAKGRRESGSGPICRGVER